MSRIALIDADLLDGGTRFPNLALMKISGYTGGTLVESYEGFDPADWDEVYVSKVFDFTRIPDGILEAPNIHAGGTGFYFADAAPLPSEIEHCMPNYHLYDSYIANDTRHLKQKTYWDDYRYCSIGFATRGCFRQCPFCVNQRYRKVEFHSHVSEWLDPERKYICLLDDNILGYSGWRDVFGELEDTGKPFIFKQGMDMRLMSAEKAQALALSHYRGDFVFAFDNLSEAKEIDEKLTIWREFCSRKTRFYVLSGFEGQDGEEIDGIFQRIAILSDHKCSPYIMRHKNYLGTSYEGMFVQLARWANQPQMIMKKTFREFVESCQAMVKTDGFVSAPMRAMIAFEEDYPEIAARWFDRRFGFTLT